MKPQHLRQVAEALMADPDAQHFGWELSQAARVRSGPVYIALTQMLRDGWLVDGWENPDLIGYRRPPRRYYTVTDQGRAAMADLLNT